MIALIILLTLVALSIFITRIATQALVLTGLSEEIARFQARSVFTGTGYTTNESETIVAHPLRRRIILWMMLAQSAGLVTVISTFVLTFIDTGTTGAVLERGLMLVGGLALLAYLATNQYVENLLQRFIDYLLDRFTDLKVRDYYTLLHLQEEYAVQRFQVDEGSWLEDHTLKDLNMPDEGVIVLCIERDGKFMGAPGGDHEIQAGDHLTIYGAQDAVSSLRNRSANEEGEEEREEAERKYEKERERQRRRFKDMGTPNEEASDSVAG